MRVGADQAKTAPAESNYGPGKKYSMKWKSGQGENYRLCGEKKGRATMCLTMGADSDGRRHIRAFTPWSRGGRGV